MRRVPGRVSWAVVVALVLAGAAGSLLVGAATVAGRAGDLEGLAVLRPGSSARLPLGAGPQVVAAEARCADDGCEQLRVPTVLVLDAAGSPVALEASTSLAVGRGGGPTVARVATVDAPSDARYIVVVGSARDPRVLAVAVGPDPLAAHWPLLWPPLLVMGLLWTAAAALGVLLARRRPAVGPGGAGDQQ
jgi:hypothetical protein